MKVMIGPRTIVEQVADKLHAIRRRILRREPKMRKVRVTFSPHGWQLFKEAIPQELYYEVFANQTFMGTALEQDPEQDDLITIWVAERE